VQADHALLQLLEIGDVVQALKHVILELLLKAFLVV
jgi:hypothetical protein